MGSSGSDDRFARTVARVGFVVVLLLALVLFVDWPQVWADIKPILARWLR